jgi:serine protease Do
MQINVRDENTPRKRGLNWKTLVVAALTTAALFVAAPMVAEEIAFAVQRGQHAASREHLAAMSEKDDISPLFNAVAETVKPSVVVIHATKKVKVHHRGLPDEFLRDLPFELPPELRGPRGEDRFRMLRGEGSGVIVDAENGYVLTNYHVAGDAEKLEVVLADGRTFESEWVRGDEKTDLAVIKIDAENLIACPLGDSDELRVGHWVLAIGSPMGLPQTVTAGVVSGKGRVRTSMGPLGDPEGYRNYIQTDAAINRGNSGGPLVNTRGEVVGINTMILSNTGMFSGVGMAIPSNMARNVMDQLIESGKVVRGYLGVHIQDVDEQLAESFELPHTRGALVTQVQKGSPADEAGVKLEDFITSVNDEPVNGVDPLRNRVASLAPGTEATLGIIRKGERTSVTVKLGTLPGSDEVSIGPGMQDTDEALFEKLGLEVQTLDEDLAEKLGYDDDMEGALIQNVAPDSNAHQVGLRPGMVITHVGSQAVKSAAELAEAVEDQAEKGGIRFRVATPTGGRLYVFVTSGG